MIIRSRPSYFSYVSFCLHRCRRVPRRHNRYRRYPSRCSGSRKYLEITQPQAQISRRLEMLAISFETEPGSHTKSRKLLEK